jgi:hypothetical protein
MQRVLMPFPTTWDARQLAACPRLAQQYEVVFTGPPSEDWPADFDILGFLEAQAARLAAPDGPPCDGVFSSSDYPGATVAAALATRAGLPGSRPEAILRASHKWASRQVQQRVVPEAVPRFHLVDPRRPDDGLPPDAFPCFVKPVKGAFSLLALRVDSPGALRDYLSHPAAKAHLESYVRVFDALVAEFTDLPVDGRFFIAEGLLRGRQATVEGFLIGDRPHLLGVVDSVIHSDTGSFVRFDYPSSLPADVQRRMVEVTGRVVVALGLRDTLYNVELVHDAETDGVFVVEVNPRMCGQFADLYEKVDGVNGYEVALAVATGRTPPVRRGQGRCGAASSFPLRVWNPVRVDRAPSPEDVAAAEALAPGALVWSECETGQALEDFRAAEDGHSCRYAIVNLGAARAEDLPGLLSTVTERLDYGFTPL